MIRAAKGKGQRRVGQMNMPGKIAAVAVRLAVLPAVMASQIHRVWLSQISGGDFKRVGLHYTALSTENPRHDPENAEQSIHFLEMGYPLRSTIVTFCSKNLAPLGHRNQERSGPGHDGPRSARCRLPATELTIISSIQPCQVAASGAYLYRHRSDSVITDSPVIRLSHVDTP